MHFAWGSLETGSPFRENSGDLVDVPLADEFVGTRVRLEENGVDRPLGSIVRMEMKLALCSECIRRDGGLGKWKTTAPQFGWKQSRGSTLAALFEKLASAKTDRVTRFLWTTQSRISRERTCGTEANSIEDRRGSLGPGD
jgi:hypothetical protein